MGAESAAALRDLDRRNMVGRYAAIIYRVADGQRLDQQGGLHRHLYAHEHGIVEWDPAWGGWAHSAEAAWQEFRQLKLKGRI